MRKDVGTTLDIDLYNSIKIIAVKENKKANDLLEEGMKYVIDSRKNNLLTAKKEEK